MSANTLNHLSTKSHGQLNLLLVMISENMVHLSALSSGVEYLICQKTVLMLPTQIFKNINFRI